MCLRDCPDIIAPSANQEWELGVRDHSPSAFDVALLSPPRYLFLLI